MLIPPVNRPTTQSSSGSSGRGSSVLPTPPAQAARQDRRQHPLRQASSESEYPKPPVKKTSTESQRQYAPRQLSNDLIRPPLGPSGSQSHLTHRGSSDQSRPRRTPNGDSNELGNEIQNLLGGPPKPVALITRAPPREPRLDNDFQADWLSHPAPGLDFPQTPRTESVYIPVTLPKDRPIIPKGGLAAAPPPKMRASPSTTAETASPAPAVAGNKWADRLRGKR